jgi:hypothetical protein
LLTENDSVDVLIVVGGLVLISVGVAGLTFLMMRKAAAKAADIDRRLRPVEAKTGRCGACDGAGTRIEVVRSRLGASQVQRTCWRCGGSGLPPEIDQTSSTDG